MAEPTPFQDLMVNDRYWLGRARGMVDQAVKARDEAASRLVTGVGWLWTVYTGAALVGVALADRSLAGWRLGLLVVPGAAGGGQWVGGVGAVAGGGGLRSPGD